MIIEKFYSDYGKLCTCGDTIHSYEIERPALRSDWNGKVKAFCYTCQAESEFHVDSWLDMPDNASKAAALHRATRGSFFRLFARSLGWQRVNAPIAQFEARADGSAASSATSLIIPFNSAVELTRGPGVGLG
jgi:hypothetical protein